MFTGSSSVPSSPGAGTPIVPTGLLQEFKKKTLLKINKLATPTAPTTGVSPLTSPRGALLSPRNPGATIDRLSLHLERFNEHDALLRHLETQLGAMLALLHDACVSMGRVVEVFTQSLRYDAVSYRVGVDYLAAMKQVRRERAHLMDQAIRFTVLDPLISRIAKHDEIRARIADWRQLCGELEREERRRSPDADRLAGLRLDVESIEKELVQTLDRATNASAVRQHAGLFTTMRLQLATFFYHTNATLFSRLTDMETEIVAGVGLTSPRVAVANGSVVSTMQAHLDERPEDAEDESPSEQHKSTALTASGYSTEDLVGEDEKPEESRPSITLEEFEQGKLMPLAQDSSVTETDSVTISAPSSSVPLPQLLALASYPVVDTLHHDEEEDPSHVRYRNSPRRQQHTKHKRTVSASDASSVFSSIRKSLNEKFGSPRGADKSHFSPPVSPTATTTTASSSHPEYPVLRPRELSAGEWSRIEMCLWSRDRGGRELEVSDGKDGKPSIRYLPDILEQDAILYALGANLCLTSIARLGRTTRRLRVRLSECPSVWKRSIRFGGLSPRIRSAVWLSVLYGDTPWASSENVAATIVPHHLKSREKRQQIYESLLVRLGARIAEGLLTSSASREDVDRTQLVAWLREIDVDVARTQHKTIDSDGTGRSERAVKRTQHEASIRRVLRAYAMYNPRVGYCQGMNFLVRLLMQVCGGEDDEADCFWLFVGLCEPENDRNLYEPGLAVLQPLFARFEAVLAKQKPQLYAHFQSEGVPVAAFTTRWFLTFFSTFDTFDAAVVVRILDVFVIDGWRIVFGMAMVVLDELEPQLLSSDMEKILRMLHAPRASIAPVGGRLDGECRLRQGLAYSITSVMLEQVVTGDLARPSSGE